MSVIIRLQNLPWTANARDIRNFFTGLSIPEGGVHIIGGEMGDAFIAFSTDEDARCAMLKDREKLMEIQVRLLLSSRAEMQKVIETARLASTAAAAAAVATPTPVAELPKPRPPTVVAPAVAMPPVPQPPIIGGLSRFLLDPQQQALAKQQLVPPVAATPSFLAYQQQAGITLADVGGVKVATLDRHSPEQGYFSSRRRQSRSRSLSRSSSSEDSDRSRDRDPRYRSRKRRADVRSDSSERELKLKPQPVAAPVANNIMPWAAGVVPGVAPAAAPPAMVPVPVPGLGNMPGLQQQLSFMSVLPPVLQSYSSTTNTSTTNNYNLNTAVPPQQQQPLQPQYPVMPDVGVVVNKQVTQKQQEPIAFANVNPYAQIYPQLFQQQQQLLLQQQTAKTASGLANSPGSGGGGGSGAATVAGGVGAAAGSIAAGGVGANSLSGGAPIAETCYIKISGMCPTTSYSDLRKYFAGLYIPHNGIKIINGANGVRTGIAYIEFSRVSSAQKALSRNNTMFRDRLVQIAPVGDEEFEQAEELVQRSAAEHSHSRGGGRGGGGGGNGNGGGSVDDRSTSGAGSAALSASAAVDLPPTCVLFVEDLPQLTTEQDIMKMFSELYTVVDILLTPSPKNRRESVAYVLFARENEARSALENTARHYIGFRKLRVHASNQLIMQAARDKMRRASEQLLKEEQQQREDAEREALQQQLQQQQQQQQLQLQLQQQQELLAKQNSDPRRRNNDPIPQQQQQQLQQQINNNNNNLQPFGNPGMHNGNNNMPFAFQQQQQQQQNNNNNNMAMHNNNINNNNMGPFGMPHNNNNQQMQHPHQGNPQRREDVFVRVHNCEYGTRVNDLGELFVSEQLRIEHIEMLFNERNQSAGEFIVEFCDTQSSEMAIRLFHNRRFRGRSLRIVTITPQEIADRMNKPFMDYLPRTNAARPGADADADAQPPQQQQQSQSQPQQQQQQQQSTRRRGPSRFDNDNNRNNNNFGNQQPQQQQQSLPPPANDNGDNNNSSKQQQHFNPFAVRTGPELGMDDMAASSPKLGPINPINNINNNNNNDVDNDGIPDKFNRPGCVVAMRNVPFKADLKDILRFFSDYKLSPDDIIRRFRDDGKPTGDARVAFESPSEARSAFESRRRKLIFNRNVVLEII